MLGLEKFLNEITFVFCIITMACVFLVKKGIVNRGLIIFLCILTLLLYLCSRLVNNNNSKLNDEDKKKLEGLSNSVKDKKGKK